MDSLAAINIRAFIMVTLTRGWLLLFCLRVHAHPTAHLCIKDRGRLYNCSRQLGRFIECLYSSELTVNLVTMVSNKPLLYMAVSARRL